MEPQYVTPFRSQDYSQRTDVTEIQALRQALRASSAERVLQLEDERFRLLSAVDALSRQNDELQKANALLRLELDVTAETLIRVMER
jgi:hypothetical protein